MNWVYPDGMVKKLMKEISRMASADWKLGIEFTVKIASGFALITKKSAYVSNTVIPSVSYVVTSMK